MKKKEEKREKSPKKKSLLWMLRHSDNSNNFFSVGNFQNTEHEPTPEKKEKHYLGFSSDEISKRISKEASHSFSIYTVNINRYVVYIRANN